MKNLNTILLEIRNNSDPYEALADAERIGEITTSTFFRACAAGDGLCAREAVKVLRENYQRAGVGHLCPV